LDSLLTLNLPAFISSITHIIAPAFVLAYSGLAVVTRMTRATMLETLTQDYIKTAKAKGVSNRRVIIKHVMRNSLIPVVTAIGLMCGGMLGGTFLIETVFSWPGIGNYAARSIIELDFNVIMGVTIVYAVVYVLVNLIVDIAYAYLDPRIEFG
jgi:peptide/nickel transport system permease protein